MPDDTDLEALAERTIADAARVRPVLDKVADKWSVMILSVICLKPIRFNEIKRRLDGITHKALSDTLKRLERHGLISRTVLPTSPVGVEYAITPIGHSLREPYQALYEWVLLNADAVEKAALSYDHARAAEAE